MQGTVGLIDKTVGEIKSQDKPITVQNNNIKKNIEKVTAAFHCGCTKKGKWIMALATDSGSVEINDSF